MDDNKMVESMWALANGITSFAVVQALAFLYALGNPIFQGMIKNEEAPVFIYGGIVVATVVYGILVHGCWSLVREKDLSHKRIWCWVTRGRIIVILLFNALAIVAYHFSEAADNPIKVDRSNYQKAEVARNFNKWAAKGANNKLMHMTSVTPSGPAPTVRMNRDTLYSAAILDTSSVRPVSHCRMTTCINRS